MRNWITFGHISDRDIVLLQDGEVEARQTSRVKQHLETCARCRARQHQLTETLETIRAYYVGEIQPPIPDKYSPSAGWNYAYAGWSVAALGLVLGLFYATLGPHAGTEPNPRLTPGAVVALSSEEVCRSGIEDTGNVPATLAHVVFAQYGIRNPAPRTYELDYLITPALGGAQDARNLWPQPYASGEWNARVKDALEDRLRSMVCSGELDLQDAQKAISADWVAAYRKYFRTSSPLAQHRGFSKDMPWE